MSTKNINSIISIVFLFISILPSSYSLSFNFSNDPDQLSFNFTNISQAQTNSINLDDRDDAYITDQGIELTWSYPGEKQFNKTGRATYIKPLHLWDWASRNLTDFTTRFSFTIDSSGSNIHGDGLAFFLAPNGSSIMPGGSLGLGNRTGSLNSSDYSFVAVEFDTYKDFFDPTSLPHVGIDINSMESVNTTIWQNNVTLAGPAQRVCRISNRFGPPVV